MADEPDRKSEQAERVAARGDDMAARIEAVLSTSAAKSAPWGCRGTGETAHNLRYGDDDNGISRGRRTRTRYSILILNYRVSTKGMRPRSGNPRKNYARWEAATENNIKRAGRVTLLRPGLPGSWI